MTDAGESAFTELWVCFTLPPEAPPPHALVLSFMAPSVEAEVSERWGARLVCGRSLINEVRPSARAEYVRLIARLGSTVDRDQRTLRQALQGPGGYSRWWLLWPTEKDCVSDQDTIYTTILQLMVVQAVRGRYRVERVRLHGASAVIAEALGKRHRSSARAIVDLMRSIGFGLAARVALIIECLGFWLVLRRLPRRVEPCDVLLQGYWDWSVRPDEHGGLRDRYFVDLPSQLARRGVSVGWLASCETQAERWQRGRKQRDVLAASCAHSQVTLLERYWVPADIVQAACDLRYPLRTTRFVFDRRFRAVCTVGPLDLFPLVREPLLRAAWGSTFCRLELIATATARACRHLRPRMVLTFMELFVRARAIYAGVSASSTRPAVWAAQHGGYSSDKTLGVADPDIEMRGSPDGCVMPAPDGIFAMGDLSRRIWQATGFSPTRVMASGGLRYQSVQIRTSRRETSKERASILLACGMNEAAEIELCDAVLAAVVGLPIDLLWRDHPTYQFSRRRAFRAFQGRITVTSQPLSEDLDAADLVLFTHAGIAEEALLRGIPAWQWLWAGFNTSPFLDVPVIPTFTSVPTLRRELQSFVREPARFRPTADTQRRVLQECFGSEPAGASVRIADAIQGMIAADVA